MQVFLLHNIIMTMLLGVCVLLPCHVQLLQDYFQMLNLADKFHRMNIDGAFHNYQNQLVFVDKTANTEKSYQLAMKMISFSMYFTFQSQSQKVLLIILYSFFQSPEEVDHINYFSINDYEQEYMSEISLEKRHYQYLFGMQHLKELYITQQPSAINLSLMECIRHPRPVEQFHVYFQTQLD